MVKSEIYFFAIALNVAITLMTIVGQGIGENGESINLWANPTDRMGLANSTGDSTDIVYVTGGLTGEINPTAPLQSDSSAVDRFLDFMHLGWISRLLQVLNNLMYGFPNFLKTAFSSFLSPQMNAVIWTSLIALFTFGWVDLIWTWRTGRSILG